MMIKKSCSDELQKKPEEFNKLGLINRKDKFKVKVGWTLSIKHGMA